MICLPDRGMPSSGTHHSGGSNLQFESHFNVPKRKVELDMGSTNPRENPRGTHPVCPQEQVGRKEFTV